jgi:hypothetical protein
VLSDRASVYASLDVPVDRALQIEAMYGRAVLRNVEARRFASGEGRHGVQP